jgi:hypothetical protein
MILPAGVRTTPLGGGDLTAYLASMLESCTTDPYSAQSARRRFDIARAVKERHAYVAEDFEAEVRPCLLVCWRVKIVMAHSLSPLLYHRTTRRQTARCGGGFEREVIDVMKFQREKLLVQDGA